MDVAISGFGYGWNGWISLGGYGMEHLLITSEKEFLESKMVRAWKG